jgi:hypothetical protein
MVKKIFEFDLLTSQIDWKNQNIKHRQNDSTEDRQYDLVTRNIPCLWRFHETSLYYSAYNQPS